MLQNISTTKIWHRIQLTLADAAKKTEIHTWLSADEFKTLFSCWFSFYDPNYVLAVGSRGPALAAASADPAATTSVVSQPNFFCRFLNCETGLGHTGQSGC